jgi:molecular chaperone GrpE
MAEGKGENSKADAEQGEKKEKTEQKDDAAEMKDRLLRLAAEFDNYKKRTKAEIESAKQMGKAEMMKEILPILDEFELAMLAVGKSTDRNTLKGIELLFSNFAETLKKQGLQEIETKGMVDPYRHEVVLAVDDATKKPGTIIEVLKKGYTLNGIILRHSSVIVAKESDSKSREMQEHDDKEKEK